MFVKDVEINIGAVLKKLSEIITACGKKRTDKREQIELLHELQLIGDVHTFGPVIIIKIKFSIVSFTFDYNPKVSDAIKPEYWSKILERIMVIAKQ
ncbi:eukaryotic translation initiation factor 3 subunit C-like [Temnothorax curvispinosus]|uniref:Eukaryotic translation initiation factor 3 subunit C-like n=1 Tax=Temnothorax curvispinosus TaxID=300111 RepID=A0A6J1PIZ2_9HYME|nr:eukaryotic translation initiation factor 3 subunit C-like [Temnothorax curvispinosus]